MGTENDDDEKAARVLRWERGAAALFYGVSSLAVIFINKIIMSEYGFPYFDFLAAVQFAATTLILSVLIFMRRIESIPSISFSVIREVLPISVMFLGNVLCGLGSTRSLNLPMFTALRRFSILMTMVAESCLLGARPSSAVVLSVGMMVGGALVAAVFDLSYDLEGYVLVFLNNLFTALNGVWMKKALGPSGQCSKMAVLYYNSLFCGVAMLLFFSVQHASVSHSNSLQRAMSRNAHLPVKISSHAEAMLGVGKVGSVQLSDRKGRAREREDETVGVGALPRRVLQSARSFLFLGITPPPPSSSSSSSSSSSQQVGSAAGAGAGTGAGAGAGAGAWVDPGRVLRGARRGGGDLASSAPGAAGAAAAGAAGAGAQPPPLSDPEAVLLKSSISQILAFPGWARFDFLVLFTIASLMGSVLNYSIFLCTTLNSALTTAVIGCLKNVLTTYVGMIFFTDYLFNWTNFLGLNISIAGSLYYTYMTLFKGERGFGGQ